MFPFEIFNIISFDTDPYMFSVNKSLNNIYNDNWFELKLQNIFPGRKLFTTTNYKDLYKNYLSEGIIYYINDTHHHKIDTKGVKAQYIGCNHSDPEKADQILTFNGELYLETGEGVELIDTNVIDISSNAYIKHGELYTYFFGLFGICHGLEKWLSRHINVSHNFKQVLYDEGVTWILTENGLIFVGFFQIFIH
jgi:hypothetical protein